MRKGKGWSLLELLTVIAIIAILVAILFPVFSRAKEAAKKATCLSNISQLAKAMRLYSLDYQEYIFFDRGRTDSALMVTGQYGQGYYLKKIMKNYIPNWDIWYCPSDMYAKKDFTCSAASFGCFNWTSAVALDGGVGY
jgi:prepilin-type N-terminal cleavage/methylation domain-containing protein